MRAVFHIAADELRYWRRTRLALVALATIAVLAAVTALHSAQELTAERAVRAEQQEQAHDAFLSQPARHPHRMVHYGHYVFRPPPPLAAIEPGIDTFTGRSMFLEGHRQNTATFSRAREAALLARFGELSPAFVLQTAAPLLLILIGFSSVVREREAGVLPQLRVHGVRPGELLAGKGLALALVAGAALVPVGIAALWPVLDHKEQLLPAAMLLAANALYLACFCLTILAVSGTVKRRASALAALLAVWVVVVVIVPRAASDVAAAVAPAPGKTEMDLAAGAALRQAGDGHNPEDAAFATLEQRVLAQYGVETIEELPINFRGLASLEGERGTSEVHNRFAAERMARELEQTRVTQRLAAFSPTLALRHASMASAGTDLLNYHRFLVAAEEHRYRFVQALNKLHAEALSYDDDSGRSGDPDAEQRTRIDAANWALMPEFVFAPAPGLERVAAALPSLGLLLVWLAALGLVLRVSARKLVA